MKLLQLFPRPAMSFIDDCMDAQDDFIDNHLNYFALGHPLGIQKRKQPSQPRNFRATVNCAGYAANEISTEVVDNKLIVMGRKGGKNAEDEDYSLSEFRRRIDLPENVDAVKRSSFLMPHGQLIVEMPFKRETKADDEMENHESDLMPKIVPGENDNELAQLKVNLPKGVDPAKVKVTVKERDVIVRVEDKNESSHFYYYRRCTMPKEANMEGLECLFDNENGNQLVLRAPLERKELDAPKEKIVPIEFNVKKQNVGQE